MTIVIARRVSQVFFFVLFLWLVLVNTLGEELWQVRGWPVNLFLNLDPLNALGTLLSTGKIYSGLALSAIVIGATIILGRFFCGFMCPLGSLNHFVGYLAHGKKSLAEKVRLNRYRKGHAIKYLVLALLLVMAALPFAPKSLQTGLLDPIPLLTRTFNLVLVPLGENLAGRAGERFHEGGLVVLLIFAAIILANLAIPRFFCRFLCPLGALYALLGRYSIFRIGQNANKCMECDICDQNCEGGCEPAGTIHTGECVLCFNCLDDCPHDTISYQRKVSTAGEIRGPEVSRRAFLLTLGGGVLLIPTVRLAAGTRGNWDHTLIRPPGSLAEEDFLERCIKCGQCMRICPTNIIQPADLSHGVEGLWSPVLNFRIGTSGCQYNCVACGQSCPTAAIRPITLAEKQGTGEFEKKGPVRLGTAWVDRSLCLPWSMKTPCIVCQENCPVSPKAIFTENQFSPLRDGKRTVKAVSGREVTLEDVQDTSAWSGGDYYLRQREKTWKVQRAGGETVELESEPGLAPGESIEVTVRLQLPYIDMDECVGCGICEHECPVTGKKAIRVTADGETREKDHRMNL
jgi:polyferredoxin